MFSRYLGSAVGVAVFGAIANATLADRFAHPPGGVAGQLPERSDAERWSLDGDVRAGAGGRVRAAALFDATHHVFVGVVATALVLFARAVADAAAHRDARRQLTLEPDRSVPADGRDVDAARCRGRSRRHRC